MSGTTMPKQQNQFIKFPPLRPAEAESAAPPLIKIPTQMS